MNKRKYQLGIKRMLQMKDFGNFAEDLPYFCFVDDHGDNGAAILTNGSLLITYEYRGKDLASSSNAELNAIMYQLNSALSLFEEGWSIHVDVIRQKSTSYINNEDNDFGENVTAAVLDEEGFDAFSTLSNNLENKYYMSFCYLPPSDLISSVNNLLTESNATTAIKSAMMKYSEIVRSFVQTIDRVIGQLDINTLAYLDFLTKDQMLSFLNKCICNERQYIRNPEHPVFLSYILSHKDIVVDNYPKIGEKYLSSLTIYDLPHSVYPGILDELNYLNLEFRANTRFIILNNDKAVKELNKLVQKWKTKRKPVMARIAEAFNISTSGKENEYAIEKQMEAESQLNIVQASEAKYGFYTCTILLFNSDLDKLSKDIIAIESRINIKGFTCKREDVNNFEAYMGSLPGKTFENVVQKPIFTHQLAALFPITAAWTGDEKNPCPLYLQNGGKNPVLGYVKTDGNSPFRLCLHSQDVGHTMIIGPAGSGKSVLLNFIASQHARYKNSNVFYFDKGASSKILNYAYNGVFYDIISEDENGEEKMMAFQPLAKLETTIDKIWAENWLCNIVEINGVTCDLSKRKRIKEAIKELSTYTMDNKSKRTMSELCDLVQDQQLRDVFIQYTKADSAGKIFDGNDSRLELKRFSVFEMNNLLNLNDPKIILPIIEFLFKQIELKVSRDTSPSLIILDEAWVFLDNPVFRDKIKGWLKEMRKYNCAVIFATQNLSEAFNSAIADTLMQECQTKILLANQEAVNPAIRKYYEKLGLNDNQIKIISYMQPKKDYYIIKKQDKRMFQLGLESRPALFSLIAQSGVEINNTANKFKQQYQDEFAYYWWKQYEAKKEINLTKEIQSWNNKFKLMSTANVIK